MLCIVAEEAVQCILYNGASCAFRRYGVCGLLSRVAVGPVAVIKTCIKQHQAVLVDLLKLV